VVCPSPVEEASSVVMKAAWDEQHTSDAGRAIAGGRCGGRASVVRVAAQCGSGHSSRARSAAHGCADAQHAR
jgi:hypothetical protein